MKKFTDEFDVVIDSKAFLDVSDYDAFKDKDLLEELRNKIVQNLIDSSENNLSIDKYVRKQIDKSLEGYDISNVERSYIYNLIDNEISGFGPITELLEDPSISEIMVNGTDEIYIEIDGRIIKDDSISFINNDHIIRTIQRMIQPLGRTIDAANPMVDARLTDGSRLNAVIPPLSVKGPILTVRKFKENLVGIEDLLRNGTMTPYMARFLEACIKGKLNVIVCGGTGSGKTTLLNVLSTFIGSEERIITIEDAAELRLPQEHVVSLETKVSNYKKEESISIRDLVINSLRMRPDRIIVGEVRGKEAFDMLQAMNTGHNGSLTTMHSNSPHEALNRLETMVLMAGMEIPIKAIREYIYGAIDIVVQVSRLSDGRRKVVRICELIDYKNDELVLADIFEFNQTGITENGEVIGEFVLNDFIPKSYVDLKKLGIDDLEDIFES